MMLAEVALPFLSSGLAAMGLLIALLFVSLPIACSLEYGKERMGEGATSRSPMLFLGILAAYLIDDGIFVIPPSVRLPDLMIRVLNDRHTLLLAFLPLFFLAFFGVYLWRDRRKTLA